ncbi:MAG: hypothetical protein RLZZ515_443 [Cyanobacteriota bacterium]|jgi:hypothetical protein
MTTPPDFKALCAELVEALQYHREQTRPINKTTEALARARAALEAQPEPVDDRIAKLEAELERERLRLAACGVVAMADTPESAKAARDMHADYWSASLDDVIRQVDALMKQRLAALEAQPEPVGPTDEELEAIAIAAEMQSMVKQGGLTASTPNGIHAQLQERRLAGLRAIAARWGRPAIEPIPVSERLPGPEDCDAEGRCWRFTPETDDHLPVWVLDYAEEERDRPPTHWLPHWALSAPRAD